MPSTEAETPSDHTRGRELAHVLAKAWFTPMLIGLPFAGASRPRIDADVVRWAQATGRPGTSLRALLARYPEFRTLYCYRLRRGGSAAAVIGKIATVLYPGERTLHLACGDIGGGLFIQHGFATVVAARKVGENCWINQQVTIGFDRPGARPTLGDNVSVHAGAKVLGDITLGDGCRIGANAVVLTDIPPGHTAVGVPARMLPPKPQRPQ